MHGLDIQMEAHKNGHMNDMTMPLRHGGLCDKICVYMISPRNIPCAGELAGGKGLQLHFKVHLPP